MRDLYSRTGALAGMFMYRDRVTIAGLGGTGSWVALLLAMTGSVGELVVFDDDIIEDSNLNRTPYTQQQVGQRKTDSIVELIYERRPDQLVIPVPEKWEWKDEVSYGNVFVDCTDNMTLYNTAPKGVDYYRGGYDARAFSIYKSTESAVWDVEDMRGYQQPLSYVIPPVTIASSIVEDILWTDVLTRGVKTFSNLAELHHGRVEEKLTE